MQGQLTALERARTAAEQGPSVLDLWETRVWATATGAVIVPLLALWVLIGILH